MPASPAALLAADAVTHGRVPGGRDYKVAVQLLGRIPRIDVKTVVAEPDLPGRPARTVALTCRKTRL